jgi:cytochrome P450
MTIDRTPPAFDPLDPAFIDDPYPFYHRLREEAPVVKVAQGFWLLSRHDDVALSLRDHRRFCKDFAGDMMRRYGANRLDEPAIANLARTMLVVDPPDHTRLRTLVTKAFTARKVTDMRPRIRRIVDEQLDRVAAQGEMDVVNDLAHRLPVLAICDMLGIPKEHRAQFLNAGHVSGRILDPVPLTREEMDRANAGALMGHVYFDQLCELRRREPKDDVTTALVQAEEAGDRLTTEELRANIGLLFAAGHETTAGQISSGLLALHRNPDQWERLRKDPSLIPNAVEELLRYDSAVQMGARVTTEAVELGGVTIPANESVVALLGAANRDPAQYRDPDRLDIGRQNVRPMSFGGGIHHCLGAQLARLEIELAITALIERFPTFTLPDIDTVEWKPNFTLRGLRKLRAVWH